MSPSRRIPGRILEITEKYAIESYTLFAEALEEFTRLGFQIAVDDVGAGHSGLEKIARLNPRYDRELIKDIDSSHIRREMTRALKAFADPTGSTIICWSWGSITARASSSVGPPPLLPRRGRGPACTPARNPDYS